MTTESAQTTAKKPWLSDQAKGVIHHVAEGVAAVAGDAGVGAVGVAVAAAAGVVGVAVAAGAIAAGAIATAIAAAVAGACVIAAGAAGAVAAANTTQYANDVSERAAKWCRRMGMVLGFSIPMTVGGAVYGPAKDFQQKRIDQRAAAAAACAAVPVPATPSYTIMGKDGKPCLVEQFKGANTGDGTILVLKDERVIYKLPAAAPR